mmetsp:Transcript_45565/g.128635  ORF Transcript_45565/g.128635 Transcript_45565/m.128635 type:complete len:217 (-) Transcript_45565:318-968(-)
MAVCMYAPHTHIHIHIAPPHPSIVILLCTQREGGEGTVATASRQTHRQTAGPSPLVPPPTHTHPTKKTAAATDRRSGAHTPSTTFSTILSLSLSISPSPSPPLASSDPCLVALSLSSPPKHERADCSLLELTTGSSGSSNSGSGAPEPLLLRSLSDMKLSRRQCRAVKEGNALAAWLWGCEWGWESDTLAAFVFFRLARRVCFWISSIEESSFFTT